MYACSNDQEQEQEAEEMRLAQEKAKDALEKRKADEKDLEEMRLAQEKAKDALAHPWLSSRDTLM